MGERRAARVERRHVDLFDAESFGPGIGGCDPLPPITPRRPGELRRIVPAVRREHWSAQIVLALCRAGLRPAALVGKIASRGLPAAPKGTADVQG
jgi:hypothetical protein